jgi:hypothetical protein
MSGYRGPQTVRHVGRVGGGSFVLELVKFGLSVTLEAIRLAVVLLTMALRLSAWVAREVIAPACQAGGRALQRQAAAVAARAADRRRNREGRSS